MLKLYVLHVLSYAMSAQVFILAVYVSRLRKDRHVDVHEGFLVSDEKLNQVGFISGIKVRILHLRIDKGIQFEQSWLNLSETITFLSSCDEAIRIVFELLTQLLHLFHHIFLLKAAFLGEFALKNLKPSLIDSVYQDFFKL